MKIGSEELSYKPEDKKALDMELFFLNVLLFLVIFAFSLGYFAWPVFFLIFYMLEIRIFIGNHDRFHTDVRDRFPRFFEAFTEWLAVTVTPWDEPYNSIKKKHIKHHNTHGPGKSAAFDRLSDPHIVFELGGFLSALLNCLFYEETQLILDIQNRNITKDRWIHSLTFLPLQILFVVTFGWEKYLGVFLAMRIVGFTAWFIFSWVIHQPLVYQFGFAQKVPAAFRFVFSILNGNRVTEGVFHHATHHAWPGLPAKRLNEFDAAVLRNPGAAPDLRAIGQ